MKTYDRKGKITLELFPALIGVLKRVFNSADLLQARLIPTELPIYENVFVAKARRLFQVTFKRKM